MDEGGDSAVSEQEQSQRMVGKWRRERWHVPSETHCQKTREVRNLGENMEQQNPSQPSEVTGQLRT